MRLIVFLAAALCSAACSTSPSLLPSNDTWQFSGTVSALEGTRVHGPIPGAQLSVVSGVNSNATVTSDGAGRYVFNRMASGTFTLKIAAPGYVSVTPVVHLYRDVAADFALQHQ
ncbi:MAG TPA: carboxypeptidase-like regulatory domain-containing protein [Vicinamibacterales bacterium]|nr:carboxypeptidase-like regulatory domain-containing protein [Vicinamibacterales bacterium]